MYILFFIKNMNDLNWKILYLFYLIYDIKETDKEMILKSLEWLSDDEIKQTIVTLYERYEEKIKNSSVLIKKLQIINNSLEEELEKANLDEIKI